MDIKEMGERTNPERGASTVALEHYREILAARQHLWRWVDIADALGYPNVNALNKAFLRIDKLVAKGKLKPTGGHAQRKTDVGQLQKTSSDPSPTPNTVQRRPLPGQMPVGGEAMNAELAKRGITFK